MGSFRREMSQLKLIADFEELFRAFLRRLTHAGRLTLRCAAMWEAWRMPGVRQDLTPLFTTKGRKGHTGRWLGEVRDVEGLSCVSAGEGVSSKARRGPILSVPRLATKVRCAESEPHLPSIGQTNVPRMVPLTC